MQQQRVETEQWESAIRSCITVYRKCPFFISLTSFVFCFLVLMNDFWAGGWSDCPFSRLRDYVINSLPAGVGILFISFIAMMKDFTSSKGSILKQTLLQMKQVHKAMYVNPARDTDEEHPGDNEQDNIFPRNTHLQSVRIKRYSTCASSIVPCFKVQFASPAI